jgi:hypothetical protein
MSLMVQAVQTDGFHSKINGKKDVNNLEQNLSLVYSMLKFAFSIVDCLDTQIWVEIRFLLPTNFEPLPTGLGWVSGERGAISTTTRFAFVLDTVLRL